MALGKNVKTLREQKNWTLKELSQRSKVPVGTIGAIEVRDSVRSEYASKLAQALGVSTDELMSATPPAKLAEIFPPNSQNFKPNQSLAPVDIARPATNLIACLTYLTGYLQGLDPSDRKAAMVQIASLVDEPQRCAKVVASIEAMAGTGFAQAGQKAA